MNPQAPQRLRDGWASVELREIGRIVTGSTPPKAKTEYYGGSFPFVKPPELRHGPVNDAKDKLSDEGVQVADIAPIGSVLVSCIGNLGKTGLAMQPVAFNQQINAIIPNNPNASKWIFYAVQTSDFASQLAAVASATTIAIVNKGKFSGLRIPMAPEEVQREIVAEIEKQFTRLDAGIAGLRRVQVNLKRYRAAVLKAACEGKLVPTEAELARQEGRTYETGAQLLERILTERRQKWNGKGKYKEPVKPDMANLPQLPEGWTWATVNQLSVLVTDGDHNPPKRQATGVPHLTAKNVRNWHLDLAGCTFVSDQDAERVFKRYRPESGDLIITCVGTVGRTAIVPAEFEFSPDRNLAAVRLVENNETVKFLNIVLSSPDFQERISVASGSTAQPHFYLGDLRVLSIAFPPLAEQQRIVAEEERRLSVVEEIEAVVNANLRRATRLRQSILQRGFEGQLFSPECDNSFQPHGTCR